MLLGTECDSRCCHLLSACQIAFPIGKATVKEFYLRGAKVIMACRNMEAAKEAAEEIKKECENSKDLLGTIHIEKLDLSSLESVRDCAKIINEKEERIDVLVNNAGVGGMPLTRTKEGFELTFATNHLGHFLFTLLLLPKIRKSAPARIVNVSSDMHAWGSIHLEDLNWDNRKYSFFKAYADTKLHNVLFTQELVRKLQDSDIHGINVYCLHPGVVHTEWTRRLDESTFRGSSWIYHNIFSWFLKTPQQGAQTTIYCSVDEKCANESGLYYCECAVTKLGKVAQNKEEEAKRLWEESLKLVGLPEHYNPFV